jgi:uncharacterized coiled-coil protein SlyX
MAWGREMTTGDRIKQLEMQVANQEAAIKRLWVDRQRHLKRIAIQQWIIDKAEQAQPKTWKEQIMAEASEVFKDG